MPETPETDSAHRIDAPSRPTSPGGRLGPPPSPFRAPSGTHPYPCPVLRVVCKEIEPDPEAMAEGLACASRCLGAQSSRRKVHTTLRSGFTPPPPHHWASTRALTAAKSSKTPATGPRLYTTCACVRACVRICTSAGRIDTTTGSRGTRGNRRNGGTLNTQRHFPGLRAATQNLTRALLLALFRRAGEAARSASLCCVRVPCLLSRAEEAAQGRRFRPRFLAAAQVPVSRLLKLPHEFSNSVTTS